MVSITIPQYAVIIPLGETMTSTDFSTDKEKHIRIESNQFIIRTLYPQDANNEFLGWFNQSKMLRGLNISDLNFTLERFRKFISGFDSVNNYFLGIYDKDDDSNILGFYTIDVNLLHKTASITTGIGNAAYVGKGMLWSTIDAVLDYFYAERDIEKFTARILARNYAMLFNFKNNTRFVLEAHLKQECLAPDGSRVDLLVFASYKIATGSKVPHRVDPRHVIEKK